MIGFVANCRVCGLYIFKEEDCIAYKIKMHDHMMREIEFVNLEGRSPWSGINCVCNECCRSLRQALKDIGQ